MAVMASLVMPVSKQAMSAPPSTSKAKESATSMRSIVAENGIWNAGRASKSRSAAVRSDFRLSARSKRASWRVSSGVA